MGFLTRFLGIEKTHEPKHSMTNENTEQNFYNQTDPKYQQAIVAIPVYWKQYSESLRLIRNTTKCDTYFDRKKFAIARLGVTKDLIEYIGGSDAFIDLMTNTEITVTTADVDTVVEDLKSEKYDVEFIKRYAASLSAKVASLKTQKAKLNNIQKWQQWLAPFSNQLSLDLNENFKDYCDQLEQNVLSQG